MYEPRYLTAWRKSSRCGDSACVEVAQTTTGVAIRDSKKPQGSPMHLTGQEFASFIAAVAADGYEPRRL